MTLASRMRLAQRALLLLALPALATAQPRPADEPLTGPPAYRLELIVFEYPEGRSDARPAADPLDYTRLPDPRLMAAARSAVDDHLAALQQALPMLPDPIDGEHRAWLGNDNERIAPAPDPYLAGIPLSAPMRDALERLEASPDHLPVVTLAWVQPAGRGQRTPMLRVHDGQVVDRIEPPAPPAGFFFPDPEQIERALAAASRFGTRIPARAPEPHATAPMIPGLPRPPLAHPVYRIDGGVRLHRGQFLRLHLDLVLQQPSEPARMPGTMAPSGDAPEWTVHKLEQTRAIRPGRFEYFDSSRFGVLARLTRFERMLPKPEPEPATRSETGPAPQRALDARNQEDDRQASGAAVTRILARPDSARLSIPAIGHD